MGIKSLDSLSNSIRKQDEQVMMNKPISSTSPWPLYQLLLQIPVLASFNDELAFGPGVSLH